MKFSDIVKEVKKPNLYQMNQLSNSLCCSSDKPEFYVSLNKAVNGFIIAVNGRQIVCNDIGELQEFLEELYG